MVYETDLSDEQWELVKDYFAPHKIGQPRKHDIRSVVNGLIYLTKTGCHWHLLPKDFPPYKSVWYYFKRWRKSGLWEKMQEDLHRLYRVKSGREKTASLGIIDSQSVKTAQKGGR